MGIKSFLRSIIKLIYPQFLYYSSSYSQDGEDMVLKAFYEEVENDYKGYYIDIGAHHPFRFSNTQYFYKKGWNGINIEPTITLINAFNKYRKRDINLNLGVAKQNASLTFYEFDEPALNSFDKKISLKREQTTKQTIIKESKIEVLPLSTILEEHVANNQIIDFFTIDAEGLDFEILQSNNWDKFIPKFILIESDFNLDTLKSEEVYLFLTKKNYTLVARTQRTSIYKLEQKESI